jgi:hypothetical protein
VSVPSSTGGEVEVHHLLKMEPTQSSETSAFNTQTPGKYPEDNPSLLQHGESLKSRKEVHINHITVYVSFYTETDPNEMLSPSNGRLSGANKVGSFRADSLARYLLNCGQDSSVAVMGKRYLIGLLEM